MKFITRVLLVVSITFCFAIAASAATFNVNTINDVQDATPGDGICDNGGGGCSVRAAITEANALAGDDIINIPPGQYTQTINATDDDANAGGDWDITSNITIHGSFGANSVLQASGFSQSATERVLEIVSSAAVVTIDGVTFRGGNKTGAPSAATRGGGIRNVGTLTLNSCTVEFNNASGGGGIRNEHNITINSSIIQKNGCNNGGATCFGGGMYNNVVAGSVVTINNSYFYQNTSTSPAANGFGFAAGLGIEGVSGFTLNIIDSHILENTGVGNGTGGSNGNGIRILATAASVVNITNSQVTSNTGSGGSSIQGSGIAAFTGVGGTGTLTGTWDRLVVNGNFGNNGGTGIFVDGTSAPITLNVINSTISTNGGSGTLGGGVALTNVGGTAASAVTLNFLNSTLSGNNVTGSGGAIFVEQPVAAAVTANFNYCTIANNNADAGGGGIFRSSGTVNIKNSIVANNISSGGAAEMAGTINSQDYNHFKSTTGATITGITAHDATGDPFIGPLGNHGGPTQTHVPNPASPVINAIPNGASDCGTTVTSDQNLLPRPSGAGCDKGSVERAAAPQHVLDFDGNGVTDFAVVRNISTNLWCVLLNNGGTTSPFYNLGAPGDKLVAGDYDGDNTTDIALWRPSTHTFIIYFTGTAGLRQETFGIDGDDPSVVGDYNGDGKDDIAVWRPSTGTWYWRTVQNGPVFGVQWGQNGDHPAPGDYDGDGKNDFVVRRDDGGQGRFWRALTTGSQDTFIFGTPTDLIAPGDYDGDGKTDICVIRDKGGQLNWWMRPSGGGPDTVNNWGLTTDSVVQGDYDGDGKTDRAIWRPDPNPDLNYFYIDRSAGGGLLTQKWGQQGDFALGSFNTH